jgi:hypothetical protein
MANIRSIKTEGTFTNNYKLPHFTLTPRNLLHQKPKYVESTKFFKQA